MKSNFEDETIKNLFGPLRITKEALEKANYLAKRVVELSGENIELYLYLTNFQDRHDKGDIAVRDIYIAKNQIVDSRNCDLEGAAQIDSGNDIINNLKQEIVGWGHSHGMHPTHHSPKDDKNIVYFLQTNGLEKTIKQKGGEPLTLYYTISLVFNARASKPHCATTYSLEYQGEHFTIDKFPFEIIQEQNNISFDKAEIDRQLFERVKVDETPLVEIYSKRTSISVGELLKKPEEEPKKKEVEDESSLRIKSLLKDYYAQQEKEKEISLREELLLTTETLRKTKEEFEKYRRSHSYPNEQYAQLTKQNQDLIKDISQLKKDKGSLEAKINSIEEKAMQQQEELKISGQQIEKETIERYKKSEEYNRDIEVLVEEKLSSSKKKIEESLSKTYKKQIVDLKKSENSIKQQNKGLVLKVSKLSEENKSLKDEKNKLNREFNDYKSKYNQKSFKDLQKRHDKLELENKELKGEKTQSLYKRIIKSRVLPWALAGSLFLTSLSSMFLFYRDNEKTLTVPVKQTYQAQQDIQELQDRYKGIEEKLNQSDSKIQNLTKTIEEVREQYRNQNEELENVKKNYGELSTKYNQVLEENNVLEDKITDIKNKNERQSQDIDSLKKGYSDLKNEYNLLKETKGQKLKVEKSETQDSTNVFSYELKGQLEKIARKKGLWGIAEHFGVRGNSDIISFIKDISTSNNLKYNDTNNDGIGPDLWKKSDLDNGKFKISQYMVKKYNLNL